MIQVDNLDRALTGLALFTSLIKISHLGSGWEIPMLGLDRSRFEQVLKLMGLLQIPPSVEGALQQTGVESETKYSPPTLIAGFRRLIPKALQLNLTPELKQAAKAFGVEL